MPLNEPKLVGAEISYVFLITKLNVMIGHIKLTVQDHDMCNLAASGHCRLWETKLSSPAQFGAYIIRIFINLSRLSKFVSFNIEYLHHYLR